MTESKEKNYAERAAADARDMAENFVDEMCEMWRDARELSTDLNNDYTDGDSYHHESHVDKSYRLTEAAALLDELSDHEETDTGLWEGMDPREAVSAQAAYSRPARMPRRTSTKTKGAGSRKANRKTTTKRKP